MTTSETALLIQDKALSQRYEIRKFRHTAPVTRAWLERAAGWALNNGFQELAARLCHQAREMEV